MNKTMKICFEKSVHHFKLVMSIVPPKASRSCSLLHKAQVAENAVSYEERHQELVPECEERERPRPRSGCCGCSLLNKDVFLRVRLFLKVLLQDLFVAHRAVLLRLQQSETGNQNMDVGSYVSREHSCEPVWPSGEALGW